MATLNQRKQIILSFTPALPVASYLIHLPGAPPCVAAMRASKKASNLALESSSKLVTSAFSGWIFWWKQNLRGKVVWKPLFVGRSFLHEVWWKMTLDLFQNTSEI